MGDFFRVLSGCWALAAWCRNRIMMRGNMVFSMCWFNSWQITGIICIELTSSRSWPRGARYFCLDTKVPKKSSQQIGFFARMPLPCKSGRTTAAIILPCCARTFPTLLQKLAMPLPALKASIVLPAFTRSLPADGSIHITGNDSEGSSTYGWSILQIESEACF